MSRRGTWNGKRAAWAVTWAAILTGCATLHLTMNESALVVSDTLASLGYAREEPGLSSSFEVTPERFVYRVTTYEVAEDITVAADGTRSAKPRRGKILSDRRIDILWAELTRIYVTKQDRGIQAGHGGEFVCFCFPAKNAVGHWVEETFAIGEIMPNMNA